MDRRRFVPAPEGLEVRMMLATTGNAFSFLGSGSNTTQTLPITFPQKELRIQKMPTNLRALQPDRTLPPITINQIQLGLNEIMSQINPAPPRGLTNYNLEMRNIVHNTSLSAGNVQMRRAGGGSGFQIRRQCEMEITFDRRRQKSVLSIRGVVFNP